MALLWTQARRVPREEAPTREERSGSDCCYLKILFRIYWFGVGHLLQRKTPGYLLKVLFASCEVVSWQWQLNSTLAWVGDPPQDAGIGGGRMVGVR